MACVGREPSTKRAREWSLRTWKGRSELEEWSWLLSSGYVTLELELSSCVYRSGMTLVLSKACSKPKYPLTTTYLSRAEEEIKVQLGIHVRSYCSPKFVHSVYHQLILSFDCSLGPCILLCEVFLLLLLLLFLREFVFVLRGELAFGNLILC